MGQIIRVELDGTRTVIGDDGIVPSPIIMSKTMFNKYVAKVFNPQDFLAGADAFQAIMDACAAASGRVKFAYTQYSAAATFEKSEVELFTAAMLAAGIMTKTQRDAILNNWPEA